LFFILCYFFYFSSSSLLSLPFYLLAVYLAMIMTLDTFAVIGAIFVLTIYHRPKTEPIPSWLQNLTLHFLMKLACWDDACADNKKRGPGSDKVALSTDEPKKPHHAFDDDLLNDDGVPHLT
jgi:hypothetical protein